MKLSTRDLSIALLLALMASAGCDRTNNPAIAEAKAEVEAARLEAQNLREELTQYQARAAAAEGELAKLKDAQVQPQPTDADRRAAEWVLRVGGIVRVFADGAISDFPGEGELPAGPFQVVVVDLNKPAGEGKLSDEGMKFLDGLKHLKELHMNNTNTVSDFHFLEGMPSLEVFHGMLKNDDLKYFKAPERVRNLLVGNYFGNPSFTDAGVSQLKAFKNLERLNLIGCQITNSSLADLADHSKLWFLSLYGTPISDDGLQHLASLSELREIDLQGAPVAGPGLVHLKGLSKLETLVLATTKVDDIGLSHLKSLSQPLNIRFHHQHGITDAGLVHLEGMSNLRSLDFTETNVTADGLQELRKSLPNCQIVGK